jgi:hypothetical protein
MVHASSFSVKPALGGSLDLSQSIPGDKAAANLGNAKVSQHQKTRRSWTIPAAIAIFGAAGVAMAYLGHQHLASLNFRVVNSDPKKEPTKDLQAYHWEAPKKFEDCASLPTPLCFPVCHCVLDNDSSQTQTGKSPDENQTQPIIPKKTWKGPKSIEECSDLPSPFWFPLCHETIRNSSLTVATPASPPTPPLQESDPNAKPESETG